MPNFEQLKPIMTFEEQENLDKFLAEQERQKAEFQESRGLGREDTKEVLTLTTEEERDIEKKLVDQLSNEMQDTPLKEIAKKAKEMVKMIKENPELRDAFNERGLRDKTSKKLNIEQVVATLMAFGSIVTAGYLPLQEARAVERGPRTVERGEAEAAESKMISYKYQETKMLDLISKAVVLKEDLWGQNGDYVPKEIIEFYNEASKFVYQGMTDAQIEEGIKQFTTIVPKLDIQTTQGIEAQVTHEIQYKNWERSPIKDGARFVKSIIEETLPNIWEQSNNITEVQFSPDSSGNVAGITRNAIGLGAAEATIYATIFADGTPEMQCHLLTKTIIHELSHAVDGFTMNQMPVGLRIELLSKVQERLRAKDAFTDETFELSKKNIEAYKQAYINQGHDKNVMEDWAEVKLMTEYFTSLLEDYLWDPEDIDSSIPIKDKKLCEWYFKAVAPDFKAQEAATRRQEIIRDELDNN